MMRRYLFPSLAFTAGICAGALGVYFVQDKEPSLTPLREGSVVPITTETSTYTNTAVGFSVTYPSELTVGEFDEGGGSRTVLFQKPGEEKGFQIFILPYAEEQISRERISTDLQGADMEDVTEIILPQNTRALHFTSVAPGIGASTEVWFIHNGYLFEVTTYLKDDAWLAEVLSTLTFK